MRTFIPLLLSVLYAFNASAQDEMPDPGFSLGNYLSENVSYPQRLRDSGVQGVVHVKFIVTSTGKLDSIRLIRKLHPALDKEAIRVVKSMPNWRPGKVNGVAVNSSYIIPFNFNLGDGKPAYVHPKQPINGPVHTYVDDMPQPDFDLAQYFASQALSLSGDVPTGIKGKVIITFVVREDGDADDIKIVRSLHPLADTIAIHYIENMPLWIPGSKDGRPVNVQYTMPIALSFTEVVNTDTSEGKSVNNIAAATENVSHGWQPGNIMDKDIFMAPQPDFDLRRYWGKMIYPPYCSNNGIQGNVTVKFAIDELGYVGDIEVVRSVHPLLTESFIKWLKEMPKWKPATVNGKPIKVYKTHSQYYTIAGSNYDQKYELFVK